jgi:hypothetical protein
LPSDIQSDKKGFQLEDAFKLLPGIRRRTLCMEMMNMHIPKRPCATTTAQSGNQALWRTGNTTEMNMIPGFDDGHCLVRRYDFHSTTHGGRPEIK